jgi:hypothetical protein
MCPKYFRPHAWRELLSPTLSKIFKPCPSPKPPSSPNHHCRCVRRSLPLECASPSSGEPISAARRPKSSVHRSTPIVHCPPVDCTLPSSGEPVSAARLHLLQLFVWVLMFFLQKGTGRKTKSAFSAILKQSLSESYTLFCSVQICIKFV